MPRKADSSQSVPAALDAIMLDASWQFGLTDDERAELVGWARRVLSGAFEAELLAVRMRLAEIRRVPEDQRAEAIRATTMTVWHGGNDTAGASDNQG